MQREQAVRDHPKAAMDVLYSAFVRHEGYMTASEQARMALDALRSMPVADRMEAMGMVEASEDTLRGTSLDFYFERSNG